MAGRAQRQVRHPGRASGGDEPARQVPHRGLDGRYEFRSVKPKSYPVPDDGPVGVLLRAQGRHPYRPAHIHFIVTAEGYEPLITALYIAGDAYIESDAVFSAKQSLTVGYHKGRAANGKGERTPDAIEFDFTLAAAAGRPRLRRPRPARMTRPAARSRQRRAI